MPSKIERLQSIVKSCAICNGTGMREVYEDDCIKLIDCDCVKKISSEISYIRAHIPKQYRDFDFDGLTESFLNKNKKSMDKIRSYIEDLKDNIENGKGMWMSSAPGLAKSSIIVHILKKAMNIGKLVYFDRASHLVTLKFEALRDMRARDRINYIIDEVDILAIEEIEKVYLSNNDAMNNQLFFEFLSDVYDSDKAILISSNIPPDEVESKYPSYVRDRLRNLDTVVFIGTSGRKKKDV